MSATVNLGELLNLVGLSTGVALYAMLLAMVLRARTATGAQGRLDPLLLLTSLLGLTWNLCAVPAYGLPRVGIGGPLPLLAAIGFGALGLLPAVVVHSVLRGGRPGVRHGLKRTVLALGYLASGLAACLQIVAVVRGDASLSAIAMRLLTYTFVALIVPLAWATRGQPGERRALWAVALAVFAVSALHLSQLHEGDASWPVELVGHHASLPLALAILYQDYPFALADLFLKRALALLAVVTLAFIVIATVGLRSVAFAEVVRRDPWLVGGLVTVWVATALLYPRIQVAAAWFVDAIVLRRPDYPALKAAVGRVAHTHDRIEPLLAAVCALLRPALNSSAVSWREYTPAGADELAVVATGSRAAALLQSAEGILDRTERRIDPRVSAVAIIATSELPRYALVVAELTGGRRLLSDDVAMLESIVLIAARRIDAIRITQERYEQATREREISRLATEAELRALRAQIDPHFLFNALTTIGYLIQTTPTRALDTLLRLTSLLRGVLRSEGTFTSLAHELDLIESYLEIERARFEQRLRVTIDVPARLRNIRVPPLLLQPLVENAVKHGIAHKAAGGEVVIRARIDRGAGDASHLAVMIEDTGAGATPEALRRGRESGVGLNNVERRLAGQYGAGASLVITSAPGVGTTVRVRIPVASGIRTTAQPPVLTR